MTKPKKTKLNPVVGVIMGSQSDWATMESSAKILEEFEVPHEVEIVSAHRTPDRMFEYAENASLRGIKVIIAGAGGAAHLPGMTAAKSILPVLGVPIPVSDLKGMDALLSIVQMPKGVPVGTLAIGQSGAINAALLAIRILATENPDLSKKLVKYRADQEASVTQNPNPRKADR